MLTRYTKKRQNISKIFDALNYTPSHMLKKEIDTALSFYPPLDGVPIKFRFRDNMHRTTMKAQPSFRSFFRRRHRRSYNVYISTTFKHTKQDFPITELPSDVLIGWIGHELGHIVDYEQMSKSQLLRFGFNYLMYDEHFNDSEYTADFYAVCHGMEDYLITTKNYILNHPDIKESYKEKFRNHYLSPDDIIHLVKERDL